MDVGIRAVLSGFTEAQRQVADLNKELDQTAESAKKVETAGRSGGAGVSDLAKGASEAESAFSGLSNILPGVIGVIGGGLATAAGIAAVKISEAFTEVRALGEELTVLSTKTGLSAEKIGSFALVAAASGQSAKQFGTVLEELSRSIDQASSGSGKAAEAFERLGVQVRNADGTMKSADTVLNDIAKRFSETGDGAGKTAIAVELLGRHGVELIPTLNQGAAGLEKLTDEARRAGLVLSNETVKAADDLNKNLLQLKSYGQSFWNDVASPIIKGLAEITGNMLEARRAGAGLFGTLWAGVATPLSGSVDQSILALQKRIADQEAGRSTWSGPQGAVMEQRLNADLQRLSKLYGLKGYYAGEGVAGSDIPKEDIPDRADKTATTTGGTVRAVVDKSLQYQDQGLRAAMESMDIEIRAGRSNAQEKIDLINAVLAADTGSNTMRMQLVKERGALVESQNKAELKLQSDLHKEEKKLVQEDIAAYKYMNKDVLDDIEKRIEAVKREGLTHDDLIARLTQMRDSSTDSTGVAVKRLNDEIAKIPTNADETAKRMRSIFGTLSFDIVSVFSDMHRSLEDNLFKLFKGTETIGEAIKNVWKSVVDSILHQFAHLAANDIMSLLFGVDAKTGTTGGSGGGGGGGSLLGTLFGNNGIVGSLFGGGGGGLLGMLTGNNSGGSGGGGGGGGLLSWLTGGGSGGAGGDLGGFNISPVTQGLVPVAGALTPVAGGDAGGGGGGLLGLLGIGGSAAAAGGGGLLNLLGLGGSAVTNSAGLPAGNLGSAVYDAGNGVTIGNAPGVVNGSIGDIGVVSDTASSIGSSLGMSAETAAGFGQTFGAVSPYLGAIMKLAQGDTEGATIAATWAALGSAFGPIGTVIGYLVGYMISEADSKENLHGERLGYTLEGTATGSGITGLKINTYTKKGEPFRDTDSEQGMEGLGAGIYDWIQNNAEFKAPAGWATAMKKYFSDGGAAMPFKTQAGPAAFDERPSEAQIASAASQYGMRMVGQGEDNGGMWRYPGDGDTGIGQAASMGYNPFTRKVFFNRKDAGQGDAAGGDFIVSRPTSLLVGEMGSERITVSPLAGAAHARMGGGVTIHVNGLSLMDGASAAQLAYQLRRILDNG